MLYLQIYKQSTVGEGQMAFRQALASQEVMYSTPVARPARAGALCLDFQLLTRLPEPGLPASQTALSSPSTPFTFRSLPSLTRAVSTV